MFVLVDVIIQGCHAIVGNIVPRVGRQFLASSYQKSQVICTPLSTARTPLLDSYFAIAGCLAILQAVMVLAPVAAAPVQTIDLRAVALSGESPVVALAGNTFHQFVDNPVIDNQGHVAFLAELVRGLDRVRRLD